MVNQHKHNKQTAFWFLFIFGLALLYWLRDYITPFLGSVILFVMLKKPMDYLVNIKKWKRGLASITLILSTFLLIVVPLFFITQLMVSKISHVIDNPEPILKMFNALEHQFKIWFNVDLLSDKNIAILTDSLSTIIPGLLSESLIAIGNIVLMYFILYFLLKDFDKVTPNVKSLLPISDSQFKTFTNELNSMTISNVIASPMLAGLQSLVSVLGYSLIGLDNAFLWGILTGIFSFIPFVGSALIWVPAAIMNFTEGSTNQALYLFLFGAIIISNIDNVFRFILQKKLADVHPLITVFGLLFGLNIFGLQGFIFGPLMISYFIIGLKLYRASYLKKENTQLFDNQ